jgi:hypothetical protein
MYSGLVKHYDAAMVGGEPPSIGYSKRQIDIDSWQRKTYLREGRSPRALERFVKLDNAAHPPSIECGKI